MHDAETDIDPDSIFLSINNNCNYYTNEKYNNNCFTEDKLTIIHFNSRSLYTNFYVVREYLQSFVFPFSVIAIYETWFNQEKGIHFEMDDYDLHYMNRQNKTGGGVTLYVHKTIKYSLLSNMSFVRDNLMECITIEINNGKKKKKHHYKLCLYITWVKY